jgi:uncharacterized protein (TIRG00374 family)
MKKYLIAALKFAVPVAIIVWLLASLEENQLRELQERDKDWGHLTFGFAAVMLCVCITFTRWYFLVRALNLPFRLRDAYRLGFLGFLFNFVSLGSVGGDLFKAFFIAREQPGRRTEAVATVVVDRIVGIYGLLLVTCLAILLSDLSDSSPIVRAICNTTFVFTGLGLAGLVVVLLPGFTSGSIVEFLAGLPKVGDTLKRLIGSLRMYRGQPLTMASLFGMSMIVHGLLAVGIYQIARGLFATPPTMAEHFLIVPLSNVAGSLPFTPAGLGSFEFAMAELYRLVPAEESRQVAGILVALTYRLITIAVAAIGVAYYWTCRSEVRDVMAAAEKAQEEESAEAVHA